MFQIPPALRGNPTSFNGHFYGRNGESIGALNLNEIETIRNQNTLEDWSAKICEKASIADLDLKAIRFARKQYKKKNPKKTEEIDEWDDATFLNKVKVCIKGRITNSSLLLLGKEESEHFLSPAVARISWILQDESGEKRDYQHFGPPLILSITRIYKKIQNLTYRYMSNNSLFPTEVTKYDPWVIRELLNNCIAHQDYTKGGRINLVEEPDSLLFTNLGHFIPGSVEKVLLQDAPQEQYRNPFLAQAMVNLNMIDTIGSGIRKIFKIQCRRFFPMPDYDLSVQDKVKVRLYGKILDENYTRHLIEKTDIPLMDVVGLDKIQKKRPISEEEVKRLKALRLIEGRRPNLFVSAKIAAITGDKAAYIKYRGFDRGYYKKLIILYLEKFGQAKRADIEKLLVDKVSDVLTMKQKNNLVRNLLQEMKVEGSINTSGTTRSAKWILTRKELEEKN
ncbi:MAG: ATP-binding protein [Candidatus Omnitrophota bacterium]